MKLEAIIFALSAVLGVGLSAEPSVNCPVPVSPPNGIVQPSTDGNTVMYTCDPGFELRGTKFAHCDGTRWKPDPPTCRLKNQERNLKLGTAKRTTCAESGCSQMCFLPRNGSMFCKCRDGYRLLEDGKSCQDVDECLNGNNGCSHQCVNMKGSARCTCPTDQVLDADGKTCHAVETHEAAPVTKISNIRYNCSIHQHCLPICATRTDGSLSCTCPKGFQLHDGWCSDVDECLNGNNGCSHQCINMKGSARCTCPTDQVLKADGKTCHVAANLEETRVSEISDDQYSCLTYGYCLPTCVNRADGSRSCICPEGFQPHGEWCSDVDECNFNSFRCSHSCVNTRGSAYCTCPDGMRLHSNNKTCIDINECLNQNFGCSHTCNNIRGTARCSCPAGYKLSRDGKTCADENECKSRRLNRCQQRCFNTNGSYECSCHHGFALVGKFSCLGCPENHYLLNDSCESCPPNSVTDGKVKVSIDDCMCLPGFLGDPSQNTSCIDIDECQNGNFGCSHECINTPGSAICACPTGFNLDADSKTCIDLDECSVKNGGCSGLCHNFEGGFNCSCSSGYQLDGLYSCADVDECAEDNGGCDQKCVNYIGGYDCSCEQGYRLDSVQKSCIASLCPRLPTPPNSGMKCYNGRKGEKSRNQVIQKEADYAVNTSCKVKCFNGFKESSTVPIRCKADGKWSGEPPHCIKLQCPPVTVPENGDVSPAACKRAGVDVLQTCYFTCRKGYKLSRGAIRMRCKRNREWNFPDFPHCEPTNVTPHVTCPDDVTVELQSGESSVDVYIPRPIVDLDTISQLTWKPAEVQLDSNASFPAGITEIAFAVNNITVCSMLVNVIDNESPRAVFCPQSFTVEANGSLETTVMWEEPIFTDNVRVKLVQGNLASNTTLPAGNHFVKYTAFDDAGNIGVCSFTINITSPTCGFPSGPSHGDPNCNDWYFGRVCEPVCDKGFILYPQEPYVFMCDDLGNWLPSDVIQDCLPFVPAENSNCTEGLEYQEHIDTGEEICVECPHDMMWSEETRMCSERRLLNNSNLDQRDYSQ